MTLSVTLFFLSDTVTADEYDEQGLIHFFLKDDFMLDKID